MANVTQRAFSSGEIDPKLYARTDFARYLTGLRTCRNFQIERTGGARNRPGSDMCAQALGVTRLMRFMFNTQQAYVMEFSDSKIRFYQNGELIGPTVPSPYAAADLFQLHIAQSGDVVTITHPSYPIMQLSRLAADGSNWSLDPWVEGPVIQPPPGQVVVTGTPGTPVYFYCVTAVAADTGEESLGAFSILNQFADPTTAAPHTVTWQPSPGAAAYRIYRQKVGEEATFGFIGQVNASPFSNAGTAPDFSTLPPVNRPLFNTTNEYPAEVSFYQQRQLFASTNNNPGTVYGSKTGNFKNFLSSTPAEDDDAVTFILAGRENSNVRFLVELGKLIVCTDSGEWLVEGDNAGVLTPTGVNTRIGSYDGCGTLPPLRIKSSLLYIQAVGNRVLELRANIMYGYYTFEGVDHTLISGHLFDAFTIVDWDYQQVPNYTVWAVRSDGTLLGFTYVMAENFAAWHRHDTGAPGDGYESVCVIPEGNEYRTYVVVRRTINGKTVRFVERFLSRTIVDPIADAGFMDCASSFDGRDAGTQSGTTLTLTGGVNWTSQESLTLSASASEFAATNVGDQRILRDAAGDEVRFTIFSYTNPQTVTGFADRTVPLGLQGTSITDWDRAVRAVSGLSYLEGQSVSIFADGCVVASPNNPDYADRPYVVQNGTLTLDRPRAYIRVGLPYISDIETLDIDAPAGVTLKERKINITAVGAFLEASRGLWAGAREPDPTVSPTDGLQPIQMRGISEDMNQPPVTVTDYREIGVDGSWNTNGRIFIRQVDPLPTSVLSLTPLGYIPKGGRE